jgi:hypothetical protein
MLHSVNWYLVTDVSVQVIGHVFKSQAVREDRLSRNVENYHSTPRNIPEEQALIYTAAEALMLNKSVIHLAYDVVTEWLENNSVMLFFHRVCWRNIPTCLF